MSINFGNLLSPNAPSTMDLADKVMKTTQQGLDRRLQEREMLGRETFQAGQLANTAQANQNTASFNQGQLANTAFANQTQRQDANSLGAFRQGATAQGQQQLGIDQQKVDQGYDVSKQLANQLGEYQKVQGDQGQQIINMDGSKNMMDFLLRSQSQGFEQAGKAQELAWKGNDEAYKRQKQADMAAASQGTLEDQIKTAIKYNDITGAVDLQKGDMETKNALLLQKKNSLDLDNATDSRNMMVAQRTTGQYLSTILNSKDPAQQKAGTDNAINYLDGLNPGYAKSMEGLSNESRLRAVMEFQKNGWDTMKAFTDPYAYQMASGIAHGVFGEDMTPHINAINSGQSMPTVGGQSPQLTGKAPSNDSSSAGSLGISGGSGSSVEDVMAHAVPDDQYAKQWDDIRKEQNDTKAEVAMELVRKQKEADLIQKQTDLATQAEKTGISTGPMHKEYGLWGAGGITGSGLQRGAVAIADKLGITDSSDKTENPNYNPDYSTINQMRENQDQLAQLHVDKDGKPIKGYPGFNVKSSPGPEWELHGAGGLEALNAQTQQEVNDPQTGQRAQALFINKYFQQNPRAGKTEVLNSWNERKSNILQKRQAQDAKTETDTSNRKSRFDASNINNIMSNTQESGIDFSRVADQGGQ